jgi:hypothetical protein
MAVAFSSVPATGRESLESLFQFVVHNVWYKPEWR